MKRILLGLVLVCSAAFAQNLGKTDAQIIAMGMNGWQDFYTKKVGYSTADSCNANTLFGEAVARRNDKLLADNLDGDFTAKVRKLRKLLNTYTSSAVDVGYVRSGGGTMWNPVYAGTLGEGELTLYAILSDRVKPTSHHVVSDVSKKLDSIEKSLNKMKADKSSAEWAKPEDAFKALKVMRSNYAGIVAIAKTMSRKDSDHLLSFCLSYAITALE